MDDKAEFSQLDSTVRSGDVEAVRAQLAARPEVLQRDGNGRYFLRLAARKDNVPMVATFVEYGVDINTPDTDVTPEGPIDVAAASGSAEVVRWMLDHGARINYRVKGILRSFPLTSAVLENHLEVVKILVEAGAAINATWAGNNALSFAKAYGRKEIEAYLRSQGAVEPSDVDQAAAEPPSPLLGHVEQHYGAIQALSVGAILPDTQDVIVRFAKSRDGLVLFTDGMADQPLGGLEVGGAEQSAELMMFLPPDWQLSADTLQDLNFSWSITLLRQVALAPRDQLEFLDASTFLFANGRPPAPLGPNTSLSCAMAKSEEGDRGHFELPDGRRVEIFTLWPLYAEERELCLKFGPGSLQRLFDRFSVSHVLDPQRKNLGQVT